MSAGNTAQTYTPEELHILVSLTGTDDISAIREWLRHTGLDPLSDFVDTLERWNRTLLYYLVQEAQPEDTAWLNALTHVSICERVESLLTIHPSVTGENIRRIRAEGVRVREKRARSRKTQRTPLADMAADKALTVRCEVGANIHTPAPTLNLLSRDPDSSVRCAVASNPTTPMGTLEELSTDPNPPVQTCVASNSNTLHYILTALAHSTIPRVRSTVAYNPSIPDSLYLILVKDPDINVRSAFSVSVHTPAHILAELARNEDDEIKSWIAIHPNTPEETLTMLAQTGTTTTRRKVAENTNTPTHILAALVDDLDRNVKDTAKKTLQGTT